jgi:hypothetical protein
MQSSDLWILTCRGCGRQYAPGFNAAVACWEELRYGVGLGAPTREVIVGRYRPAPTDMDLVGSTGDYEPLPESVEPGALTTQRILNEPLIASLEAGHERRWRCHHCEEKGNVYAPFPAGDPSAAEAQRCSRCGLPYEGGRGDHVGPVCDGCARKDMIAIFAETTGVAESVATAFVDAAARPDRGRKALERREPGLEPEVSGERRSTTIGSAKWKDAERDFCPVPICLTSEEGVSRGKDGDGAPSLVCGRCLAPAERAATGSSCEGCGRVYAEELLLPRRLVEEILRLASESLPTASCGFIVTDSETGRARVVSIANVAPDRHAADPACFPDDGTRRYVMDERALLRVMRQVEEGTIALHSIYSCYSNTGAPDFSHQMMWDEPIYADVFYLHFEVTGLPRSRKDRHASLFEDSKIRREEPRRSPSFRDGSSSRQSAARPVGRLPKSEIDYGFWIASAVGILALLLTLRLYGLL